MILLLVLLCAGALSGTIYELYMYISCFDTILHGLSGFLFACVGFSLMKHFLIGDSNKSFYACLMFAFCLSLTVAVLWELFEFSSGPLLGADMLDDTIVYDISSYLQAGGHKETFNINGITQTIIHYGDNQVHVIDGYLELGVIDTINEIFICLIGTIVFVLTVTFANHKMH